jgi:hypothetical protein
MGQVCCHFQQQPNTVVGELGEVDLPTTTPADDIIPNTATTTTSTTTTTALPTTSSQSLPITASCIETNHLDTNAADNEQRQCGEREQADDTLGEHDFVRKQQLELQVARIAPDRTESALAAGNNLKKYAIVEDNLPPALKISPKKKKKINPQKISVSPVKSKLSPLNYTIPDLRAMSPEHPPIKPHNSAEDVIVPPFRTKNERNNEEFKEPQRSDSVSSKSSTSSINTLTSISSTTQKATEAWEPNSASNACRVCSVQFGVINRKHHCRKW